MHTFADGRPMYVHVKSAEELHRWMPDGIEKTADYGSVCSLFALQCSGLLTFKSINWVTYFINEFIRNSLVRLGPGTRLIISF